MKIPSKTLERELFRSGYRHLVAVDEVGMGCLAGPVTVCAVHVTPAFYRKQNRALTWLRDSKMLQARQRERYAHQLCSTSLLRHRIASVRPRTIDRMNVYQAARMAMHRAVARLDFEPDRTLVLVDGNKPIRGLGLDQLTVVQGDRSVFAIACASILAKVHRDAHMARQAARYPGYGFERHVGYGTAYHRACIQERGPCPIHRKTFKVL